MTWLLQKIFKMGTWALMVGLIFSQLVQAADDPVMDKALKVLTQNFKAQDPSTQKNVLRQLGLMQMQESVDFLMEVSLSSKVYTSETRRDALKAMLALDSQHYRSVLLVLKKEEFDEKQLLESLSQISSTDYYIQGWVKSVDFTEPSWILETKMHHIYRYVKNQGTLDKSWFHNWNEAKATTYLTKKQKVPGKSAKDVWHKLLKLIE